MSYQSDSLSLRSQSNPTYCEAGPQQPFEPCIPPPPLDTLSTLRPNTLQVPGEIGICFKEFITAHSPQSTPKRLTMVFATLEESRAWLRTAVWTWVDRERVVSHRWGCEIRLLSSRRAVWRLELQRKVIWHIIPCCQAAYRE